MRVVRIGLGVLMALAICAPGLASALDRNDTMAAWLQATPAERSHVLDDAPPSRRLQQAERGPVMQCMDRAAAIAGHRDLLIGDVLDACLEPSQGSGSSDI